MSLFSSFLCCSSDISSENLNNNNNNNNNNNSNTTTTTTTKRINNNTTQTNKNKNIKSDNKDYTKEITIKSKNNKMISRANKSPTINKSNKDNITTQNSNSNKNNNNVNKSNKLGPISSSNDNDVMLVDSNDADEEKEYDDSEDMDIDDVDDDYKKILDSNNDNNSQNNTTTNTTKEKQTINVYTNETDRSTGSSDYGYIQQQQQTPQLTIVASHEDNNDTSMPDSNLKTTNNNNNNNNDDDNIVNNIQEINTNGQPVISTTLTQSDTNTTINTPSPISNIDPNDINNSEYTAAVSNMTAPDNMDYNMIQPFDETEEFVDLTMLQPDQYHAPGFTTLLSPKDQVFKNKKLLVLDLDETLVHSSFKYLRSADFVLPVDIDDQIHNVYVIKRPGVDEFLQRVGELYEVVVFTASVNRYGDPLLDILDKTSSIHHRLFREACYNYEGNYIKNLSQLGRPLSDIIILDNSPASYIFHPQHAIPISSWFSDTHDNELLDIIPLLEDLSKKSILDVGKVLDVSI